MYSMAFRLVKKFRRMKDTHYEIMIVGVQWREQPTEHEHTCSNEQKIIY